jgi:type IV secretory pathway VirB2 component (pilin)
MAYMDSIITTASISALSNIGDRLGLTSTDLVTIAKNLTQWLLGTMPLVAVVFIILGGFQWMTAAGDEEKVDRAKKTISAAVVGMVIILLAWAVVQYVVKTT